MAGTSGWAREWAQGDAGRLTGRSAVGRQAARGLAASVNLVVSVLDLPLVTLLGVADKPG